MSHSRVAQGDRLASEFEVSVSDEVVFALELRNSAKKSFEVQFPDGRTHDFAVLDSLGREVWRWSDGKMFTSLLRAKHLKSGDTMSYTESWEPSDLHGKFTAVASVYSGNFPVSTQIRFTLP